MIGLLPHTRPAAPLVVMTVPAGSPTALDKHVEERIDLYELLAPEPGNVFLVRVQGESMIDARIFPGDLLVVEQSSRAQSGDVVIAYIAGELTIKRFRKRGRHLWLVSENHNEGSVRHEGFTVLGVARHVIRQL